MRVFGVFLSLNGLLFILCEREKFYYFLKLGKFPDYRQEIRASKEELKERVQKGSMLAASELQKMNNGQWEEDYSKYVGWKQDLHAYLKLVYSDICYGEKTDGQ